jgi:ferritin-like protein
MNSLFFVVCIVAIACTASTVQHYMKLRAGKQDNSSELQETLLQLEQIEKRMQVLERIVTERNFDLKQEINKL